MLSGLTKHIDKNLNFLHGKKLLLAVSGGIDSMVLVHLLKILGHDIYLAHCNFGLRGKESDGDENFVRQYASDNEIHVFVTHFDTNALATDTKVSIQIAARQLRYAWFEELLTAHKLDYLITAHHLDDSAETFLINFTRGTGLEGLTGIPKQNGKIVRPLLPFSRSEIEAYAEENNIEWREDSSNASDKYLRNKLRHHVLPLLKELNPSFSGSFTNTLQHLQQAQTLVADATVLVYQQVVTEFDNRKIINLNQLLRLPNYEAYLYQWLSPLGFTAWDDIYGLVHAQSGKRVLTDAYRLLKDRETLMLEPITDSDTSIYEIPENTEKTTIPIGLCLQNVAKKGDIDTKNVIFVNKAVIKFPLFVRRWRDGDYFCPKGMQGNKKKVSKFFKDEKFSLADKEQTWLLCSGEDIVWIIGHRADERFAATPQTTQILKIEVL
ncbi:tRNA lysidine(34) synthetase TilS [Flavobacterium sp. RHBU_24]|uniref:tRNA lysidine(34) synthetase TilS n=1 Tax=Flavobacterium sp. RHBU_24 TaxID=3391185 RepID=UPI0039847BB7